MIATETAYRGLKIRAASNLHRECERFVDALGLPPGARVLDLGAGEGAFTQRLLDRGYDVTAVELEAGRFRAEAPCLRLDLNGPFDRRLATTFDLVVAMEIIEHLENPRHFLRGCLGLLAAGGHLLLTSPNVESWVSRLRFLRDGRLAWFDEDDYRTIGHITPLFSWQVRQICAELGAALVATGHTANRLLWRALGRRLSARLRRKGFYLSVLYPVMTGWKRGEVSVYLIRR